MFKKILVPLDGSDLAAKILPYVVDLAKLHDSQVTLLYVYYAGESETFPDWIEKALETEKTRCELLLARAAEDLESQGLKGVKVECLEGSPAREIINFAKENDMDLIAMSTHGKGEVAWVLGSVAEKVVSHATVPVLLFRVMVPKPLLTKEDHFLEVMERGIP
ncbi:MAG: universal stress protein [Syntrophales bacterium]|nr:universal stress protein [Syntrophales bacterium]MDD5641539.1 universal stress protein [Syntrophales bacterium]